MTAGTGAGRRAEEIPAGYRRLDSIARLITGGDVCAAVAFDGGQFLVANNNHADNDLIIGYFAFFGGLAHRNLTLSELASNREIQAGMEALVEESVRRFGELQRSRNSGGSETRRAAVEAKIAAKEVELRSRLRKDIRKVVSSLARDSEKPFSPVMKAAFVREYEHLSRGTRAVAEGVSGESMAAAVPHAKMVAVASADITAGAGRSGGTASVAPFPARGYKFVEGRTVLIEREVGGGTVTRKAHAEMCILDDVITKEGELEVLDSEVVDGRKPFYVGITFLCCPDCEASVEAFNASDRKASLVEVRDSDRDEGEAVSLAASGVTVGGGSGGGRAADDSSGKSLLAAVVRGDAESGREGDTAVAAIAIGRGGSRKEEAATGAGGAKAEVRPDMVSGALGVRGYHFSRLAPGVWIPPRFITDCGIEEPQRMIAEGIAKRAGTQAKAEYAPDSGSEPELEVVVGEMDRGGRGGGGAVGSAGGPEADAAALASKATDDTVSLAGLGGLSPAPASASGKAGAARDVGSGGGGGGPGKGGFLY
jgi:hypothetical protein